MSEQRTLASVVSDTKRNVTRRERFLQEMDRVIPWATLQALVAPHDTKPGRGRRPMPLETMLRIDFLQQWFDLSDPQAEDMRYDARRHVHETLPRTVRVEHFPLGRDILRIPGGHPLHPQVGVVDEEGAIGWA
jgi:hypothetical protein